MSGFQISGLQDDEPYDDIPSNLVSGYQNLGLQSNYSPAAPSYTAAPTQSYGGDYDYPAAAAPPVPPPRSRATAAPPAAVGGDFDSYSQPNLGLQQDSSYAAPQDNYSYQPPPQNSYQAPQDSYQPPPRQATQPPAQKWTPPAEQAAPSKYGGGDKCPRCNKTVYFAEAREGPNNIKYHKMCFTCITCSKVVDSQYNERQGDIYCKSCYGKEFGPKGFGFGGSMGFVDPNGPSPEKTGPASIAQSPTQPTAARQTAPNPLASKFGGGDKCPKCNKTVYFAEAREGPNNIKYHKACFTCFTCQKTLDSTYTERKGDVFCKSCYAKDHGPQYFMK